MDMNGAPATQIGGSARGYHRAVVSLAALLFLATRRAGQGAWLHSVRLDLPGDIQDRGCLGGGQLDRCGGDVLGDMFG